MERRPLMEQNHSNLFDDWESYRKTCREMSRAMASRAGARLFVVSYPFPFFARYFFRNCPV